MATDVSKRIDVALRILLDGLPTEEATTLLAGYLKSHALLARALIQRRVEWEAPAAASSASSEPLARGNGDTAVLPLAGAEGTTCSSLLMTSMSALVATGPRCGAVADSDGAASTTASTAATATATAEQRRRGEEHSTPIRSASEASLLVSRHPRTSPGAPLISPVRALASNASSASLAVADDGDEVIGRNTFYRAQRVLRALGDASGPAPRVRKNLNLPRSIHPARAFGASPAVA
eukprot:TRINITY_DN23553_c0_g1_i1.p1 TRINITY_DN23553_c0_g1~~TRINITY_DN23553_c0_g1_i1.p1  ORF type:complete len:256 (+),score=28.35 TRINITY_DN23553_c0_g1_i1:61-768(+)